MLDETKHRKDGTERQAKRRSKERSGLHKGKAECTGAKG
jgi:hypothetical protein